MSRSSKAGFLLSGLAALTLTPAADARHSEPYCYWGNGVLPNSEALRVTVERDHFMQDECDGTTVRVRLAGGGGEIVLSLRSEHERRGAEQREPTRAGTEPTGGQRKTSKRRALRGNRRGSTSRRCKRDRVHH